MSRFDPGEVAILRNQNGGRRFVVLSHEGDEVYERHPIESQQKYVQPTRLNQLVKVDPQGIDALLAHLSRVSDDYRFRLRELERARENELTAILDRAAV